jgi:hypothetical protein
MRERKEEEEKKEIDGVRKMNTDMNIFESVKIITQQATCDFYVKKKCLFFFSSHKFNTE